MLPMQDENVLLCTTSEDKLYNIASAEEEIVVKEKNEGGRASDPDIQPVLQLEIRGVAE